VGPAFVRELSWTIKARPSCRRRWDKEKKLLVPFDGVEWRKGRLGADSFSSVTILRDGEHCKRGVFGVEYRRFSFAQENFRRSLRKETSSGASAGLRGSFYRASVASQTDVKGTEDVVFFGPMRQALLIWRVPF